MEAGFETRKDELLDQCKIAPEGFDRLMPRLNRFRIHFLKPWCGRSGATMRLFA